jgi:hypothetical protein
VIKLFSKFKDFASCLAKLVLLSLFGEMIGQVKFLRVVIHSSSPSQKTKLLSPVLSWQ